MRRREDLRPWLFVVLAVAGVACTQPGPSAPAADVTGGHPCETEDPPATAGGEHGAPFEISVGADETGGPLLDVGALPPEDDPIAWETATASGNTVRYRSPTANEMSQYGWTHEHLLVVLPTTNFTTKVVGGQTTATAYLPIHDISQSRPQEDLDLAVIPVSRQWSHTRMPYYEKTYSGSSPTTRVSHPKLSFYVPTGAAWDDLPERSVAIMASGRGGIQLYSGTVAERVSLIGPYKTTNGPFALDIAPPSGTIFYLQRTIHETWSTALSAGAGPDHLAPMVRAGGDALGFAAETSPDAAISGKCLDGLDNDPDGFADECDYNCVVHEDYGGDDHPHTATNEYSKDFALMGDVEFCTCVAPGIGEAVLAMYAVGAMGILNNVQPPPPYDLDVRSPPFRLVMPLCEFMPPGSTPETACETARACHDDGTCSGALASYPFAGLDNDYSAMRAQVWDGLEIYIAGKPAADVHPVHIAGLVTTFTGADDGEPGLAWAYQPGTPDENGSFVVWHDYPGPGGPGANIAHEIGHTLGLGHENGGDRVYWEDTDYAGFMTQGIGFTPVLNWDLESAIDNVAQGEVWRDFVPSKFLPRASGFEYTGCSSGADCDTGHPGLGCVGGICQPVP